MIGTLMGLVNLLKQLSDPDAIAPAMALALVTTFYGSVLSQVPTGAHFPFFSLGALPSLPPFVRKPGTSWFNFSSINRGLSPAWMACTNPRDYIDQIVGLATEARVNGLLSLEGKLNETKDEFLKNLEDDTKDNHDDSQQPTNY